jgi:hypothetical protein
MSVRLKIKYYEPQKVSSRDAEIKIAYSSNGLTVVGACESLVQSNQTISQLEISEKPTSDEGCPSWRWLSCLYSSLP